MVLPTALLAAIFLSLVPLVYCQTATSGKTLMQALAEIPECKSYYEFLQRYPEAQSPPPGEDYIIFCPKNEAVASELGASPTGRVKRAPSTSSYSGKQKIAQHTAKPPKATKSKRAVPSPSANPQSATGAPRKRQVTSVFTSLITVVYSSYTTTGTMSSTAGAAGSAASAVSVTALNSQVGSPGTSTASAISFPTSGSDPFALDPGRLTLITTLDDPAFVNLGPGEGSRIVFFASPAASVGLGLKLVSGLGDIVNVIRGNIPFNRGIIHVVDNFLTLPSSISESLTKLAQNSFLSALTKNNLLGVFETTPRITAFVPIDSSFSGDLSECACKQHILEGPPLYTPDIEIGAPYTTKAGGNITIEIKNGAYTLPGGATIVKSNIITKNGVVHFIKGTISGGCVP